MGIQNNVKRPCPFTYAGILHIHFLTQTHTHTHTLSLSISHKHITVSQICTDKIRSLSLSVSLFRSLSLSLFLFSLSLSLTQTRTHTLSHKQTFALSLFAHARRLQQVAPHRRLRRLRNNLSKERQRGEKSSSGNRILHRESGKEQASKRRSASVDGRKCERRWRQQHACFREANLALS